MDITLGRSTPEESSSPLVQHDALCLLPAPFQALTLSGLVMSQPQLHLLIGVDRPRVVFFPERDLHWWGQRGPWCPGLLRRGPAFRGLDASCALPLNVFPLLRLTYLFGMERNSESLALGSFVGLVWTTGDPCWGELPTDQFLGITVRSKSTGRVTRGQRGRVHIRTDSGATRGATLQAHTDVTPVQTVVFLGSKGEALAADGQQLPPQKIVPHDVLGFVV